MEEQVRKLMEQRENLPGLRGSVVDVDDRELVIIEAEPGIVRLPERVLENIDTDTQKHPAPLFQRRLRIAPRELLLHRNAQIGPDLGCDFLNAVCRAEHQVTGNQPLGGIAAPV